MPLISPERVIIWQKAKGAGKRPAEVPIDPYLQDLIERARQYKRQLVADAQEAIKAAKEKAQALQGDKLRHRRALVKIETMQERIWTAQACKRLFIQASGGAWTENTISKRWQNACEKAGLKYFVPHEFRHSFATFAGAANFSEKYIQAAMRWDDPQWRPATSTKRKKWRRKSPGRSGRQSPGRLGVFLKPPPLNRTGYPRLRQP